MESGIACKRVLRTRFVGIASRMQLGECQSCSLVRGIMDESCLGCRYVGVAFVNVLHLLVEDKPASIV